MKKNYLIFVLLLAFAACSGDKEASKEENSSEVKEEAKIEKVNYSEELFAEGEVAAIAPKITYPVVIKNADKNDEWSEECLKDVDIKAFADVFFNLIYSDKLKAYEYMSDVALSIEQVKAFEKENKRAKIGKVLFEEEWYFDANKAKMYKKVNSVMLAYELYSESGEVKGYKAGLQIFFNK